MVQAKALKTINVAERLAGFAAAFILLGRDYSEPFTEQHARAFMLSPEALQRERVASDKPRPTALAPWPAEPSGLPKRVRRMAASSAIGTVTFRSHGPAGSCRSRNVASSPNALREPLRMAFLSLSQK